MTDTDIPSADNCDPGVIAALGFINGASASHLVQIEAGVALRQKVLGLCGCTPPCPGEPPLVSTSELRDILDSITPHLAATIGHAMRYAHEDEDPDDMALLVDPELKAAAEAFHRIAVALADRHPNLAPDDDEDDEDD